jgi:peptidoglycan/xylan/chitin deacetylase (PgdA/CDA1 family)
MTPRTGSGERGPGSAGSGRVDLALDEALAGTAPATVATNTVATTGQSGTAPSPSPPAARRRPAPLRYRPIGCIVGGPQLDRTGGPPRHEVAIGFDDGPYPLTPAFVRMLRANGAVATFFMIGRQVNPSYRATLREELRNGDAPGDHTWSHPDLVLSGEVASQLRRTREVIRRESGYTPCVFRPPYGDYDAAVIHTARSLGLATVTWNVDPADWALPGVAAVEQRVLAQVKPGSIVISHDGGGPRGQTLAAYPDIIRKLRERGYRFVTIPQLLGFRTIYIPCRLRCEGTAIKGKPPVGSVIRRG